MASKQASLDFQRFSTSFVGCTVSLCSALSLLSLAFSLILLKGRSAPAFSDHSVALNTLRF